MIARWLVGEAGTAVAERVLREIRDAAERLAERPAMGRQRPELGATVRSWPIAPYVIFYRPTAFGVRVLRVLHGARDLPRAWRRRAAKDRR